MDLAFWEVDYRWLANTDVAAESETWDGSGFNVLTPSSDNKHTHPVSDLASSNATPNIWLASDSLAKSFDSTIMTDLGQTTMVPNILLNATALQHFTQNFNSMQNNTPNAQPVPARDS